jgi:hypothetical protein
MNKKDAYFRAIAIFQLVCVIITSIYFLKYLDFPFADKFLLKVTSFVGIIFFINHFDAKEGLEKYTKFVRKRKENKERIKC